MKHCAVSYDKKRLNYTVGGFTVHPNTKEKVCDWEYNFTYDRNGILQSTICNRYNVLHGGLKRNYENKPIEFFNVYLKSRLKKYAHDDALINFPNPSAQNPDCL